MTSYETFYQLHQQPGPFLLANAWNAKSAQLIEAAGFPAIATSSGAIADALGYPDGEQIPFEELLYIIKRIKASTQLPLSVDVERGYSSDLSVIADNISQLLDTGVAGINIEDAEGEAIYLKKLEGIKNYLSKTGRQLFINARTDVFLQKLPAPLETIIRRAKLYREAGADGLFVTGIADPSVIKEIAVNVALPLNIVGNLKLASVEALGAAGVKRISMAVIPYRAAYRHLEQTLGAVINEQSLAPLF
ncbi:isocitrate lyase/phosphoenolpyruvate mutase family protein [Mucilaginibacter corticis]|uniref:Isocitrate lyase/phosphoenolpyruvate mutase family protein n=1 Tax=Mucilaginibacter corticis TaxID=2597670 RepID=A0A556MMA7_9SPHI|nr:isocitrate lyase/phosphoenolpyruvate mutase family protein [Mucilaginibacter corticis]TSJ41066.1 isocitrate lyase/phosphoenolpyruvate mutase family protein [Mucilaginibacter corticis]